MNNYPTLVPAPLAGDQDKFLCMDGTWKEYNQIDYFLNSNGNWIQNTEGYYLKGDGTWDHVEFKIKPKDAYVYLYDGNTLHFSNEPIEDHENHALTEEYFIDKDMVINAYGAIPWYSKRTSIIKITSETDYVPPKTCSYMFYNCYNISNIDGLSEWNTSAVTDMSLMFNGCSAISTFEPLNGWDVSNVTNHSDIFQGTTGTRPIWGQDW